MSFHPSLFTRVISADGTRQRRLSEVGIKKEEKENEDPRASEESSAQGEQRARVVYPESEYQGTPLVDLSSPASSPRAPVPIPSPPHFDLTQEERANSPKGKRSRRV